MKNIQLVNTNYSLGKKVTVQQLGDAIEEILSVQHSLSIVDLMVRLFRQYDENQRRRIQYVLTEDRRFTKSMEVYDREAYLAKHLWVLTQDAKTFGITPVPKQERVSPTVCMVGVSAIIDSSFHRFLAVSNQATIHNYVNSSHRARVKVLLEFFNNDNASKIALDELFAEARLTNEEFAHRLYKNVHARLKKLTASSPEYNRIAFIYA
ncbi:hypothetical protein VPHD479_0025 [Vibrio phage D479]